ncbi:hypothetical protein [Roseibacillus persicicus]|uniref:hypothetical protein n=1 Tax=Roseibacillus persicicus TaxID=454148 RepID=UPI00280F7410|nr:hypothetical protein [Roseibacillus persicicus]MDQ8191358.1 hypothetical protein [Roseibacillus persicicus]
MSREKSQPLLRWLVRGILAGLLLIVLLFAASNIFLATPAGRKFLQSNLERRSGIRWQISGASWSPWNGVTVKNLAGHLKLPPDARAQPLPPLLALKEARLKPYWKDLLRGKKLFREANLVGPELNVPVELLFVVQPTTPAPPVQPAPVEQPKPPKQTGKPKPSKPRPKPSPTQKPKPVPPPKPPVREPDEKRFWLRVRDAKVRFYSLKIEQSLEVKGLNLDLPLAGPATNGSIAWKEVALAGQSVAGAHTLPIEWKSPVWKLANQDLALTLPSYVDPGGKGLPFTVRVGGAFAPRGGKKDFRFNASLSSQAIPDYLLHQNSQFHLRCPEVAATLSASGRLTNPDSWIADCNLGAREVEVYSELRGQHLVFDTAHARMGLRRMTLIAPDLSLRSERLSLMGNGQFHLGGYVLAVMRIVADPELADRLTRVAIGSFVSGGWTRRWFQPLETPDRLYRDLHFEGFAPNVAVNTGRKGEFIPLPTIVQHLQNFAAREVAEELPARAPEEIETP